MCIRDRHCIGESFRMIKHGYQDVVIAGGTEAGITPLSIAGFTNIKALTKVEDKTRARDVYKRKVLYTTAEGIQEAFNVSFTYDQETNRVTIFTLPYLVQFYTPYALDYGYAEISETFANQKAILDLSLIHI